MIKEYVDKLVKSLQDLPQTEILQAASLIANMSNKGKVLVCGNGGDAALANHFVVDLMKFANVPAISLCDNQSMLTMIGNDLRYEDVFSWQIFHIAKAHDILICISTSGKSKNIVHAVKELKENDIISIVGNTPDKELEKISYIVIKIPHLDGPMPIEDVQSAICHIITQEVMMIKGIYE